MSVVRGRNVLAEIKRPADSDFLPVLCATDVNMGITAENIETTTVSSGRGITRKTRRIDWSGSITGILKFLDDSDTGLSAFDLISPTTILAGYELRLTFSDSSGNEAVLQGDVVLDTSNFSGPQEDYADMEFNFLGNGLYALSINGVSVQRGIGFDAIGTTFIIG